MRVPFPSPPLVVLATVQFRTGHFSLNLALIICLSSHRFPLPQLNSASERISFYFAGATAIAILPLSFLIDMLPCNRVAGLYIMYDLLLMHVNTNDIFLKQ